MSDSTPEGRAAYAAHIASATKVLIDGLSQVPHGAALDTLLSAYASTLLRHPCCIPTAVAALRDLLPRLEVVLQAHTEAAEALHARAPSTTHH